MSNDNNKLPRVSLAGMVSTVKPTQLGKKPVDLSVNVAPIARRLFEMGADGKVKVPRKRQTSDQWPKWFEDLEAPQVLYFYFEPGVDRTEDNAIPVVYDPESELFYKPATDDDGNTIMEGEGDAARPAAEMDEKGHRIEFTGDNVVEMANPDGREVESTMEGLQQLRNAITRFNGKTGKQLATRFVSAQRDSSGRTLRQKEVVYRLK